MKRLFETKNLPLLSAALGLLAAVIDQVMRSFTDANGLLTGAAKFLAAVNILLSILVAGYLAVTCGSLRGKRRYSVNFPVSLWGAVSYLALGGGILVELISRTGRLGWLSDILAIAGILCCLLLAFYRYIGRRPTVLPWTVLALYAMVRTVGWYRSWCICPQEIMFLFPLMASVCLNLAMFQGGAFAAGRGKRSTYSLVHLLGIFFCLAAILHGGSPLLYLGAGAYLYLNLCKMEA